MTAIMVPVDVYKVRRGDIVVLLPRVIESRGKRARHSGCSEDAGQYEVCSAYLMDGKVRLNVLDQFMENHVIRFSFDATVNKLEYI